MQIGFQSQLHVLVDVLKVQLELLPESQLEQSSATMRKKQQRTGLTLLNQGLRALHRYSVYTWFM